MPAHKTRGQDLFGSLYRKGETIFREGDEGETLFVIQSGAVEVSREAGGRKTVLALLERGDFFGEMALLDAERRSATITAISDTRLLPITRRSFSERARKDPAVALHLLQTLCLRLERTRLSHGIEEGAPAEIPSRAILPYDFPHSDLVTFSEGATVFRQGEAQDTMYLIARGLLEVRQEHEGASQVIARLGARNIVGEMAIVTGRPRSATVVALEPSELLPIRRDEFVERIRSEPELALHIAQILVFRLRTMLGEHPRAQRVRAWRRRWPALSATGRSLRAAVVSLSSCGGCSAVLLEDPKEFGGLLGKVDVVYCPMLMDQRSLPSVDLAIVDGAVRCEEDLERLEEVRAKSRYVVGLGTCASSGGIASLGNRFEIEELVAESFGRTHDLFGHYLSSAGSEEDPTFSNDHIALLRKSAGLGQWVKIDGYIPGCPPPLGQMMRVVSELQGGNGDPPTVGAERKPVCSECPRTARKDPVERFSEFPGPELRADACMASRGVLCLGFTTRGGCGAPCTQGGLPCWGCRGLTEATVRKLSEGETFEGLSLDSLVRFCRLEADKIRPALRKARTGGLSALNIDQDFAGAGSRIR